MTRHMRRLVISLVSSAARIVVNVPFTSFTSATARGDHVPNTHDERVGRFDRSSLTGLMGAPDRRRAWCGGAAWEPGARHGKAAMPSAEPRRPGTSRGPDANALHMATDALRAMLVGGTAVPPTVVRPPDPAPLRP